MLNFPKDIKNARILLANDDSIHSHGFRVLEETVKSLCDDVWVVAPESEQSAVGHSLTIHSPLRIRKYADKRYSVYGTPTDCVVMGAKQIMKDHKPDLVLSGINHGRNAADDVTYSGTVAVTIEATILGIPAVAFSNSYDPKSGKYNWETCRTLMPEILKKLQGQSWGDNVLINVNFPNVGEDHIPDIVVRRQGHYPPSMDDVVECTDPRGRPYYWIGPPTDENGMEFSEDTDIGALGRGKATITPLSLNLTHDETLENLKGLFAE